MRVRMAAVPKIIGAISAGSTRKQFLIAMFPFLNLTLDWRTAGWGGARGPGPAEVAGVESISS